MIRSIVAFMAIGFLLPAEVLHPADSSLNALRAEVITYTNIERDLHDLPTTEAESITKSICPKTRR